jgi:phosphoglycerate dehydrogenase-like enzyme
LARAETNLASVLADTDLLVVALALTRQTEGIVGAAELACLPAHAWLINVARGRHVDTGALTAALTENKIDGAVLDVTDPEPLPPDHPLWAVDKCLITPHTACTPDLARPCVLTRVRENVQRFAAGQSLTGTIDIDAGY